MTPQEVFYAYEGWVGQYRRYTSDNPRGDPPPLSIHEIDKVSFEFSGTLVLTNFINYILEHNK